MAIPTARSSFGSPEVDQMITELLASGGVDANADLVRSLLVTGLDMSTAEVDTLNLKIASQALAEILESWNVFNPHNERSKVTIFGSARTKPEHPDYQIAVEFGQLMAQRNWMAITGAGPGIMTAGIEGIGVENSFGVSIVLPFEKNAAPIIRDSDQLVTYKYFFTRKLTFMKESDAFALFPGGFGTLDEFFELLTLIQTGKSYPAPVVLLDAPGSTYWSGLQEVINAELLANEMISQADINLYTHTQNASEAVEILTSFYSTYHSIRQVGPNLIVRLRHAVSEDAVKALSEEFSDIITDGVIESTEATKAEVRDNDCVDLPRLKLAFNKRAFGRLIQMIRRINELGGEAKTESIENPVHDISPEEF